MKYLFPVLILLSGAVHADEDENIAKELANPISSLISVPFQLNFDENQGSDDEGWLLRMNVQPVIPVVLNEKWKVISRTVLPVVQQQNFPVAGYSEFGLSDTVQSFFFAHRKPTESGWVLGAGPVFLMPTATDEFLGSEKWGVGPTAVAVRQSGNWSIGGLVNHIESFAGDSDRSDVSITLLQPFVSYVTPSQTTYSLNTESTYDWESEEWSIPVNASVSQLIKAGNQILSLGAGIRYWAKSAESAAEGWGVRLTLTLVYRR